MDSGLPRCRSVPGMTTEQLASKPIGRPCILTHHLHRATPSLEVAHVAHGAVAHGAPQNALNGFDVILPVKGLRLLMFQASAGSQHVARGWRVAHGGVAHGCATEREPPVTCNAAVTCNGSLFAGNAAVTCNAWGRSHVSESLEAPEPEGVRCDGKD
jgi:hypothetical protein